MTGRTDSTPDLVRNTVAVNGEIELNRETV